LQKSVALIRKGMFLRMTSVFAPQDVLDASNFAQFVSKQVLLDDKEISDTDWMNRFLERRKDSRRKDQRRDQNGIDVRRPCERSRFRQLQQMKHDQDLGERLERRVKK